MIIYVGVLKVLWDGIVSIVIYVIGVGSFVLMVEIVL